MVEKMVTMTDRERILALLNRQKPDRVPIWPFAYVGFATVYTGTSIADAYNRPSVSYEAQKKTCLDFGWVFTPLLAYSGYGAWEFGGEIKWPSSEFSQAPIIEKHPVETEEDVMALEVPNVETSGIVPLMVEFYRLSSKEMLDNEPFNVIAFGANRSFTMAGNIAGPDKLLKWVLKRPALAHQLLNLANEHIIKLAKYWKSLFGTDGVLPFGGEPASSNQLISPKIFREFALPYLKAANQNFLDLGYRHLYAHICGEHNANMRYWAEIPMGDPGIVSIGHEIDLQTAAKYFPNDIILGNLNPVILQTGTPREVYEQTRKNVEEGKKIAGRYIFSPGCELPPMSPVENIKAMTQAVIDYGSI